MRLRDAILKEDLAVGEGFFAFSLIIFVFIFENGSLEDVESLVIDKIF